MIRGRALKAQSAQQIWAPYKLPGWLNGSDISCCKKGQTYCAHQGLLDGVIRITIFRAPAEDIGKGG